MFVIHYETQNTFSSLEQAMLWLSLVGISSVFVEATTLCLTKLIKNTHGHEFCHWQR